MSLLLERAEPIGAETGTDRPKPDPEWIRGTCPCCGEVLVSNCYYVSGRGYLVIWECWASRQPEPTCEYRRVL